MLPGRLTASLRRHVAPGLFLHTSGAKTGLPRPREGGLCEGGLLYARKATKRLKEVLECVHKRALEGQGRRWVLRRRANLTEMERDDGGCICSAPRLRCGMSPKHSSIGWLSRALMLALGIVAAPSVGVEALQRPHCAQHGTTGAHGGQHGASVQTAAGTSASAWSQAGTHECPHCPPAECARISPCTGASTTAPLPRTAGIGSPISHRVRLDPVRDQATSAVYPPHTPPPQPIT